MTVCGEKVTGVCVAGKCPYFKRCHPIVWDKYGKIEPKTNEEWLKSMTTEELAEWIYRAMFYKSCQKDVEDGAYMQIMTKKDYIESWLCEVHHAN